MSTEKADYQRLKKFFMPYDRIERIENAVGVGTPDVSYCIEGVDGWIEMKSRVEPKRASSILFNAGCHHRLSQTQMNWFLTHKNAKGTAFILVCTDKRWMLIDGCKYGDVINNLTADEMWKAAVWAANKPFNIEAGLRLRIALRKN